MVSERSGAGFGLAIVVALALFLAPASASAFGPISNFGSAGSKVGQLNNVGGLGVAPDGDVYVADYGNSRVTVFSPSGEFKFAFGSEVDPAGGDVCTAATGCKAGAEGTGAGALSHDESLAFDAEGNVYVADTFNRRISVFSPQGTFLYAFGRKVDGVDLTDVCTAATTCQAGASNGEAGALNGPKGIGIEGNRVYVPESDNARVSVFSTAGEFLYAFGKEVNMANHGDVCTSSSGCEVGTEGAAAGEFSEPFDAKPAPGGKLIVSDSGNHRIDAFTTAGEFLYAFGKEVNTSNHTDVCTASSGCGYGEVDETGASLDEPNPVSVDPEGNVYVGDTSYERVTEFDPSGAFVKTFGAGVLNGEDAFQICTVSSECMKGHDAEIIGSTPHPYGVAADCRGALYVSELGLGFTRVERFGESGTLLAPCPPAPPEPPVPSSSSQPPAAASTPPATEPSSNAFVIKAVRLNRRNGTATVGIAVPDAGTLTLSGTGLLRTRLRAGAPATVKLTVRAAGATKRSLARTGKATARAQIAFLPDGGTARKKSLKLTLREKLGATSRSGA